MAMTDEFVQVLAEFLAQQHIDISLDELWVNPATQRVSALCYLEHEDQVLMLRRWHEPYAGMWTAPGGKLKIGETPEQAVIREIREETGLDLIDPELRVVVSETGADPLYNWLLFGFWCPRFRGSLKACDEGELRWVPRDLLPSLPIPDVDRHIHPLVFSAQSRFVVHVEYGKGHTVASIHIHEVCHSDVHE